MSAARNVVATQLTLAAGSTPDLEIDGVLSYDPADPLAVSLRMSYGDQQVHWTFARDLLVNGLYEPTGEGDVHVWPCLSIEGNAVVIIELSSPNGEILLQAPSRTVSTFVDEVQRVCPAGSEDLDVDGLIAQLLAS